MNIAKNMEAIFIVAIALSCVSAFAAVPHKKVHTQVVANSDNMISVTIVGKRLSAAQKAQLGS
jgi:hypothetical protein